MYYDNPSPIDDSSDNMTSGNMTNVNDNPSPIDDSDKCLTSYKKFKSGGSITVYSPAGPEGCPPSDSNVGGWRIHF